MCVSAHNFIAVAPYSAIFPEWDLHYIWKMKMRYTRNPQSSCIPV